MANIENDPLQTFHDIAYALARCGPDLDKQLRLLASKCSLVSFDPKRSYEVRELLCEQARAIGIELAAFAKEKEDPFSSISLPNMVDLAQLALASDTLHLLNYLVNKFGNEPVGCSNNLGQPTFRDYLCNAIDYIGLFFENIFLTFRQETLKVVPKHSAN